MMTYDISSGVAQLYGVSSVDNKRYIDTSDRHDISQQIQRLSVVLIHRFVGQLSYNALCSKHYTNLTLNFAC